MTIAATCHAAPGHALVGPVEVLDQVSGIHAVLPHDAIRFTTIS